MTEKLPTQVLTPEQIERIAGGECTVGDWFKVLNGLTSAYESLIDFTSHVMERVTQ